MSWGGFVELQLASVDFSEVSRRARLTLRKATEPCKNGFRGASELIHFLSSM